MRKKSNEKWAGESGLGQTLWDGNDNHPDEVKTIFPYLKKKKKEGDNKDA